MRKISLDQIKPGMYLSRPLVASDGTVLLYEGIEIKERYIDYLRKQGLTNLFIGDAPEPIVEETEEERYSAERQKAAIEAAREAVAHFRVGRGINLDRIKKSVGDLIHRIGENPENMVHLLDLRRKEEYMFSNSVNACILSVMTGVALGYSQKQLDELGLAAMLHDIGKIKFTGRLAQQFPYYLTKDEREEYKQHTYYSLEVLREDPNMPYEVINACFQHHERWNGSGYPLGIKGEAISEYAQIISLADCYDRLIVGLPHRKPTPVYYAAAILNRAAGEYFSPELVDKFTQHIVVYPMGKMVRLSSRESGIILGVGINRKTTPVVRILYDRDGKPSNQVVELDLNRNPDYFIVDFEDIHAGYIQAYTDHSPIYHPIQRQV